MSKSTVLSVFALAITACMAPSPTESKRFATEAIDLEEDCDLAPLPPAEHPIDFTPYAFSCAAPVDECTTDELGEVTACGQWVRECITVDVPVEVVTADPEADDEPCGYTEEALDPMFEEEGQPPKPKTARQKCYDEARQRGLDCINASTMKRTQAIAACVASYNTCIASGAPQQGCATTQFFCEAGAETVHTTEVAECLLRVDDDFLACRTGLRVSVVITPLRQLGGWVLKLLDK